MNKIISVKIKATNSTLFLLTGISYGEVTLAIIHKYIKKYYMMLYEKVNVYPAEENYMDVFHVYSENKLIQTLTWSWEMSYDVNE